MSGTVTRLVADRPSRRHLPLQKHQPCSGRPVRVPSPLLPPLSPLLPRWPCGEPPYGHRGPPPSFPLAAVREDGRWGLRYTWGGGPGCGWRGSTWLGQTRLWELGDGQHPFLCASPGPTSVPQELTPSLSLLLPPVASWDFPWAFGGLPLGDRRAIVATLQEGKLRLREVR